MDNGEWGEEVISNRLEVKGNWSCSCFFSVFFSSLCTYMSMILCG